MSDKHSPTPYAVEDGVGFHVLRSANGDKVATVVTPDDAEFIAAACNHHAGLIRLVEYQLERMASIPLGGADGSDIAWFLEAAKLVAKLKGGAA